MPARASARSFSTDRYRWKGSEATSPGPFFISYARIKEQAHEPGESQREQDVRRPADQVQAPLGSAWLRHDLFRLPAAAGRTRQGTGDLLAVRSDLHRRQLRAEG